MEHFMRQEAPSACKSAAELAVNLLGQGSGDLHDVALLHLQRLINLLEQYFHPSENGS